MDVTTGWPARSFDQSYSMIYDVHDQDYVASLQISKCSVFAKALGSKNMP